MVYLKRLAFIALAALAALAASVTLPVHAAPGLETFVMGTTGQSTYGTYRIPDPNYNTFFLGNTTPDNPAGLAASNIAGEYRVQTSATAPTLADSIAASASNMSNLGTWNYSGSAATRVSYGQVGAEAHAVHTGYANNATVNNADAYAIMRETLNPSSPGVSIGSTGRMRLAVTVDGSMLLTGKGIVGMALRYDYGTERPGVLALNRTLLETFLNAYGNGYQILGPHSSFGTFVTPPGMSLQIGTLDAFGSPSFLSFGGLTTVYADVPITFGMSNDFRMGMLAWAGVGNGNGTMDSGFGNTATITGIEL
ncbi:MAG: hypothetical protein H7Y38_11670, partial [Armatimonadetes bacterium]|nr:hypothetical protein [Armatimonadota bacterium]